MNPERSTGRRGWSRRCSVTAAGKVRGQSSTRLGPTCRGSRATRRSRTTSRFWYCVGTDLADADFYAAVARLGNALSRPDQRLSLTSTRGEDPFRGNAHAHEDRLHALGALQGQGIIGRIRAHLISVADDGDFGRLPPRHLGDDALYFLLRLLGEFIGAALEIEREGDRARRHRRQGRAEYVLHLPLAGGIALQAAAGRARSRVGAV